MYCVKCGKELAPDSNVCDHCGAEVSSVTEEAVSMPYGAAGQNGGTSLEDFTLPEFYNRYASKTTKNWVSTMVVVCFLTAGLSFVLTYFSAISYVVDAVFYLVMGILLLKKRNWIFALIPTVYSAFFSILNLAMGGGVSGSLALVFGVLSTIYLKKVKNAYKAYKENHIVPFGHI